VSANSLPLTVLRSKKASVHKMPDEPAGTEPHWIGSESN